MVDKKKNCDVHFESGDSKDVFNKGMDKIDEEINAEAYKYLANPFRWWVRKIKNIINRRKTT